jgi:hypothetical protein
MIIEIQDPELETLIQRRMAAAKFRCVEELSLAALKSFTVADKHSLNAMPKLNFADFLLSSPLPGSNLDLTRVRDLPRNISL